MHEIVFKNGSKIEYYTSTVNHRSKRSELIWFYCHNCQTVHKDYPIKNVQWIGDNIIMCKESYDKILAPYTNKERINNDGRE